MPADIKVGGGWKTIVGISIKVGGLWKDVVSGFIKVAGLWKQFFGTQIEYTFYFNNTLYIGTNGQISFDSPGYAGTSIVFAPGRVLGILPADLVQENIYYAADALYFYMFWIGKRFSGGSAGEIQYEIRVPHANGQADISLTTYPSSSYSETAYYYIGSNSGGLSTVVGRTSGSKWLVYFGTTTATSSSFTPHGILSSIWLQKNNVTSGSLDDGITEILASQGAAPSAPTSLYADSVLSTTATINWAAPSDLGMSALLKYQYRYSTVNDFSAVSWINAYTSTSINLTGLTPNILYYWQVSARNQLIATDGTIGASSFTTIQYTVTWDYQGGTGSPASTTVNTGSAVTAPTPTRSGYTFSTWRYPLSGGDPIFIAAGGSYTPPGNITFYAIWTVASPVNTAAPTISGTVQEGQTVTGNTGTWTGSGITYTYQWKYWDSGSVYLGISGATSSTYAIPSNYRAVYGTVIRIYITATNAGGAATANSSDYTVAAAPVPSGGIVSISPSGTQRALTVLTATTSGWSGSPTSYNKRIYASTSNPPTTGSILKASNSSSSTSVAYTITQFDSDNPAYYFKAFTTATNAGGTSSDAESNVVFSGNAPSTPTSLQNTYSSGPSWACSWIAPGGSGVITYYWVLRQSASNGGSITATASGNTTGTNFTQAMSSANGLWAYFTVYASNVYGTSSTIASAWA